MPTRSAVDDVRARVTYETISSSSTPTETNVSDWIDEAEALQNGRLRAAGITPPTAGDGATILGRYATDYAEGRTRKAWASAAGSDENQDGVALVDAFDAHLKDIEDNPTKWGAMLDDGGDAPTTARLLRSNVTEGSDSYEEPIFQRGDLDGAF